MTGQWGRPSGGRVRRQLRAHRTGWLLAAAIGLGVVLRLRLLSVPFERDEGEYAYAGQLILRGIALYDHAYTMKLPGVSTLYAGMMLLFGQTHTGIHFGLLLINALTSWLIFAVGKRLVGTFAGVTAAAFFAVTSTLPGVQGLWANAEHFVLPFALSGILSFWHWLGDRRERYLIASGVLLGCGVLMKQHAAAFLLFVGLCLSWELFIARTGHWTPAVKSLASFAAGAALPIGIMALIVFALDNFDSFLFWTTEYALGYGTGNTLEQGVTNLLRKGGPLWRQASAIGLLAAVGPLCLDWSPTRRFDSARLCLLALLSFLSVCPGLFFRPHYFILLLPAVALLAGASLARCHQLLCEYTRYGLLRILPGLLAIAIVGITILVNQEYLIHASPEQVLRRTYGINPFAEAVAIGEYLRENTREDEKIAVIGSEPQIYFYARRRSATSFIYTYPLMEDQPRAKAMQQQMAREIEAAAPPYLVYVNDASSWMMSKRSNRLIFNWLSSYLNRYQIVGWSEANLETPVVHWGEPESWPPRSPAWTAVYRRIGERPPRR